MVNPTVTDELRQPGNDLAELFAFAAAAVDALNRIAVALEAKPGRAKNVQRDAMRLVAAWRIEGRRITYAALAEELGLGRATVWKALNRAGVSIAGLGVGPRRGHRRKQSDGGGIEAYDDGECDS